MSMFPGCGQELADLEKRNLQNESGQPDVSKRIGIAKGKLKAPDDIDANGEEAAAMLMEGEVYPMSRTNEFMHIETAKESR